MSENTEVTIHGIEKLPRGEYPAVWSGDRVTFFINRVSYVGSTAISVRGIIQGFVTIGDNATFSQSPKYQGVG